MIPMSSFLSKVPDLSGKERKGERETDRKIDRKRERKRERERERERAGKGFCTRVIIVWYLLRPSIHLLHPSIHLLHPSIHPVRQGRQQNLNSGSAWFNRQHHG